MKRLFYASQHIRHLRNSSVHRRAERAQIGLIVSTGYGLRRRKGSRIKP